MNKWIFAFIQGALWVIVPPALGQGFCTKSDDYVIQVGEPKVDDGVLYVSLLWSPEISPSESVTIEVLDRTDTVVAASVVEAQPGEEVSYPLTEDAVFFEDHGYWYTFRVVDPQGQLLAPTMSGLVTFCRSWEPCVYRIVEGVGGDTVSLSTELAELMDDLEQGGSSDLLGDALGIRPDLDFEVHWVAAQIAHLQTEDMGTECACQWFADLELIPPDLVRHEAGGEAPSEDMAPDWEEKALTGPGATLSLAGQILGGSKQELTKGGSEQAGIHLRCRTAATWTPVGWKGIDVSMPTLVPCEKPCPDARVSVSAWAESVAVANAFATLNDGARGYAQAVAEFFMGESLTPIFTASAEVEVDRPPGNPDRNYLGHTSGRRTGGGVAWKRDLNAGFSAVGQVETCLATGQSAGSCRDVYPRPADDQGSWAHSCAKSTTSAVFIGEAACALLPQQKFELNPVRPTGLTKDGVLIKPWRP